MNAIVGAGVDVRVEKRVIRSERLLSSVAVMEEGVRRRNGCVSGRCCGR